jgi:hypothetical protein
MRQLLSALVSGSLLASAHAADTAPTEAQWRIAAERNPAIVRWAAGKFVYRVSADLRQRGFEEWRLSVHADGSRTYTMWYSVFEDHLETSAILRVGPDFRPLSVYKTTWVDGRMTNTFATVSGNSVSSIVELDGETSSRTIVVPDRFSIMIGPIAADALHFGAYDLRKGGVQDSTILASVSAGGEKSGIGRAMGSNAASVGLSRLSPTKLERVGRERVTVAAGSFETEHFRMPKTVDMWLAGPDFTLVKYQWHPNGYEYELVEFASGHGGAARDAGSVPDPRAEAAE